MIKPIPKLENTVFFHHEITVPISIEQVFQFFINNHFCEHYQEISEAHEYLTLREGETLKVGSVLDCAESVSNQSVIHEYVVSEISDNARISYYSKPSLIKIKLPWKVIDSKSNTYCFFDFVSVDALTTTIRLTVGIQFFSKFEKMFSVLTGGIGPWKKHCVEEQEGLKKLLYQQLGIDKTTSSVM